MCLMGWFELFDFSTAGLIKLGDCYKAQNEFENAERHYQEALEVLWANCTCSDKMMNWLKQVNGSN